MSRLDYPPVYIGLYALLMTSVMAAVTVDVGFFHAFSRILFWANAYGLGLLYAWRHRGKEGATLTTVTNALLCVAPLIFYSVYRQHGVDKGFVWFLIYIQAVRNLTLATRRELYFALLVSLIIMFQASSASKETAFIFYIVVYVISGVFTLMFDYMDERLSLAAGGDRELLQKRLNIPVRGGGVSISIIIMALVIYLFFPRPPSPHFQMISSWGGSHYWDKEWEREAKSGKGKSNSEDVSREEDSVRVSPEGDHDEPAKRDAGPGPGEGDGHASQGDRTSAGSSGTMCGRRLPGEDTYAGFNDSFDISAPGRCVLSNEIVFYLQCDRPIYARGRVFDTFDGRTWENHNAEKEKVYSDYGDFTFEKDERAEGVQQVYTVKANLPAIVYAAYRPLALQFSGSVLEKDDDLSLGIPRYLERGTTYSVVSEISELDGRPFGGRENCRNRERHLQLPESLPDGIKELAASVTQGADDDYSRAKLIEQYLRENYEYTQSTFFETWEDGSLSRFLFDRKKGHCEYFATSMAILLRTLGIPSRLTTGFVANRYNPVTGYYEVKKLDGHAWVEAYIDEHGWVAFEPTPGFYLPEQSRGHFAFPDVAQYIEDVVREYIRSDPERWLAIALQELWRLYVALKNALDTMLMRALEFGTYVWSNYKRAGLIILGIGAVGTGLSLWLLRFLYPAFRKWRLLRVKKRSPKEFVLHCYWEIERIFAGRGSPRPPHCSPMEYRDALAAGFQELHHQVDLITTLFQKARYSNLAIRTEDAEEAHGAYEDILKARVSYRKEEA